MDAATARRSLACALDHGITHFDLARSYGYGEAERFVGRILADRRRELVIATKFGIRASRLAAVLRPLKPVFRALRRKNRGSARQGSTPGAGNIAGRFLVRAPLDRAGMTASLDRSLRSLGTDYVDLFFVHEPLSSFTQIDELCAEAAELKRSGRIRAWGIALTMRMWDIHQAYLPRFDVVQVDNSPGLPAYDLLLDQRRAMPNVFFSPLRSRSGGSAPEILGKLAADFPRSVILCSMSSEAHIRENVEALS
jgi:aryl-alcohol dehydrogenase-like predicted oxidoreductase